MSSRHDLGDGDPCPLDTSHGNMVVLDGVGGKTQYCRDQSHDGRPKSHPLGEAPRTRAVWPTQYFESAVTDYLATYKPEPADGIPRVTKNRVEVDVLIPAALALVPPVEDFLPPEEDDDVIDLSALLEL